MNESTSPRRRVWDILTVADPDDIWTRGVNFFLVTLIVLNVLAVILETVRVVEDRFGHVLFWFEVFSVAVFSIEYLARVWSCAEEYSRPIVGRLRFMVTPLALIDFLAVLPFFLALAYDLRFLRSLRLFRLARIGKLGRYSAAIRLFGRVFVNSKEELVLTVVLMALLVVLASSFMFYAEHAAQPEAFPDIPSAMWWSIVTLTTVGYGDVYPITPVGQLFAACVAVFGVGMVALPTGILGASFVEEIRKQNGTKKACPHCGKETD